MKSRAVSLRRWVSVGVGAVVCTLGLGYAIMTFHRANESVAEAASRFRLEDIPFPGAQAYDYLKKLCQIGPRPSGSKGMEAQQKLLVDHFTNLGAKVELQQFQFPHPIDQKPVIMANVIVRWHPERAERVLLCTHYDTLPFPLRDPKNPRGRFVGANDGGSGTALLMAMGHEMPKLPVALGVDFVFFDAEEFMFTENGRFFVGSEYFATRHVQDKPPYRYRWGVLLDMVGDADLQLYQEATSVGWKDTKPLVADIWGVAAKLGVREFVPRVKHDVNDDHIVLHDQGKIPTCDIIDFDYPAWHTQADTPEHCSALSLAKVGWVLTEWLKTLQ